MTGLLEVTGSLSNTRYSLTKSIFIFASTISKSA
jgi:hypothetical protein